MHDFLVIFYSIQKIMTTKIFQRNISVQLGGIQLFVYYSFNFILCYTFFHVAIWLICLFAQKKQIISVCFYEQNNHVNYISKKFLSFLKKMPLFNEPKLFLYDVNLSFHYSSYQCKYVCFHTLCQTCLSTTCEICRMSLAIVLFQGTTEFYLTMWPDLR